MYTVETTKLGYFRVDGPNLRRPLLFQDGATIQALITAVNQTLDAAGTASTEQRESGETGSTRQA